MKRFDFYEDTGTVVEAEDGDYVLAEVANKLKQKLEDETEWRDNYILRLEEDSEASLIELTLLRELRRTSRKAALCWCGNCDHCKAVAAFEAWKKNKND